MPRGPSRQGFASSNPLREVVGGPFPLTFSAVASTIASVVLMGRSEGTSCAVDFALCTWLGVFPVWRFGAVIAAGSISAAVFGAGGALAQTGLTAGSETVVTTVGDDAVLVREVERVLSQVLRE